MCGGVLMCGGVCAYVWRCVLMCGDVCAYVWRCVLMYGGVCAYVWRCVCLCMGCVCLHVCVEMFTYGML